MKVLIIEDSERLLRSLGQGLKRSGFTVDLAEDGREGLDLCARIKALTRRRYQAKNPRIQLRDLEIDTVGKTVFKAGETQHLTPSGYALLEYLALRRGRVTSQQQLIEHLYHSAAELGSNVIEVLISGLRKKIHTPGQASIVRTRRGRGYVIE